MSDSDFLAALTVGEGDRATVLLHGFLGSGKNLRTVAVRWAEREPHRRFWLPDLLGHGAAPPLQPDTRSDDLATAVLNGVERAGLRGPLTLVGHSLGGRVALAAARVNPTVLEEVVLLDIAPGPIDPRTSESRRVLDVLLQMPEEVSDRRALRTQLLEKGLSLAIADWILMNLQLENGVYRWRIDRRALDGLHDRFNSEDLWSVVEAQTVPMRAIRGARSHYVSTTDVERFQHAGVSVETLANAGHFLHVDALDALVDALTTPTRKSADRR